MIYYESRLFNQGKAEFFVDFIRHLALRHPLFNLDSESLSLFFESFQVNVVNLNLRMFFQKLVELYSGKRRLELDFFPFVFYLVLSENIFYHGLKQFLSQLH